jgi:hypothetical protein
MATLAVLLTQNWRVYDRQFAEFRAALQHLPRGQRLVTVLDTPGLATDTDQPYWHMAEYAIPDRADMTALLFATKGQHVVQLRFPYGRYTAATAQQGSPPSIGELADLAASKPGNDPDILGVFPYLMGFQCHYDEAVVVHLDQPWHTPPAPLLHLRHQGSFFSLYDIKPDTMCPR